MSHSFPLVIGLTGGIGSGKTTVSDLFAAKGVEVVDADLISRALMARGQPLLQQLVAILGPHILLPNGELDRPGLRQRLFSNESTRLQVEALLHPAIRAAIVERLQQSRAAWVLLVAPLLLESKAYGFVDRVLVVDLPEQLQLARAAARDGVAPADIARILERQLARQQRLQQADDVISNEGDRESLRRQVDALFQRYQRLAAQRQRPAVPTPRETERSVSCPTCRKPVPWLESERFRPFCSRKCQLIDFGEWASERHAIPAEEPLDREDPDA